MKVSFATLGCRVNQYETEAMKEIFLKSDYEVVDFNEYADVYVINTCTVTQTGDKKSRQIIRRAKKNNANSIVAVVGCYSQISPDEIAEINDVDIILGTKNKSQIVYWTQRAMDEKKRFISVNEVLKDNVFEDLHIDTQSDKSRAFLKIQDGCNKFCSYCLIPYARGAVCSKSEEKIVEEGKKLVLNGYKEIVLTGIHIASYGLDLSNITLTDIIEDLENIEGLERIRLGSIDPNFFTEEVIRKISKFKKMCNHFHLSLQSGCNSVLSRMNRKYTSEKYREIVNMLRANIVDVSITTDIIVGFPGETDEEFLETHNFLKEICLTDIHVFKYSSRKGTKAYSMKDTVTNAVKEERSRKIIELNNENKINFMSKYLNSTIEVLIESEENGFYLGYSKNYLECEILSSQKLNVGDIYKVYILNIDGSKLKCKIY